MQCVLVFLKLTKFPQTKHWFWLYGRYPSLTRLRWWYSCLLFGFLRIAFQQTWSPQRNKPPHLDTEVHSLSFSLARRSTRKRRRRRRSTRKKFKRIRMSMRYFLHRYHRHRQFPSKQDLLGQGVGWGTILFLTWNPAFQGIFILNKLANPFLINKV